MCPVGCGMVCGSEGVFVLLVLVVLVVLVVVLVLVLLVLLLLVLVLVVVVVVLVVLVPGGRDEESEVTKVEVCVQGGRI